METVKKEGIGRKGEKDMEKKDKAQGRRDSKERYTEGKDMEACVSSTFNYALSCFHNYLLFIFRFFSIIFLISQHRSSTGRICHVP